MYTKNCEITYDNWRKSMLEAKKNCEENDVAPAEAFHQFSLLFNAIAYDSSDAETYLESAYAP
jgi:septin family protein